MSQALPTTGQNLARVSVYRPEQQLKMCASAQIAILINIVTILNDNLGF